MTRKSPIDATTDRQIFGIPASITAVNSRRTARQNARGRTDGRPRLATDKQRCLPPTFPRARQPRAAPTRRPFEERLLRLVVALEESLRSRNILCRHEDRYPIGDRY